MGIKNLHIHARFSNIHENTWKALSDNASMWPPPKEMVVNFTSLRTEMTCYKFTICGRAGVSTLDCLRKNISCRIYAELS